MKSVSRFEANVLRILHCFFDHRPVSQSLSALLRPMDRPRCLSRDAVDLIENRGGDLERKGDLVARILPKYAVVTVLLFFTAWRCFQCRYILSVIPLLAILGAELIFTLFAKIEKLPRLLPRLILKSGLSVLIMYALAKTFYIDLFLSFTNDMCYY